MLEQWELLEASFQSVYGLDLSKLLRVETWRWFTVRVQGLFVTDSPIARYFAPTPEGGPDV